MTPSTVSGDFRSDHVWFGISCMLNGYETRAHAHIRIRALSLTVGTILTKNAYFWVKWWSLIVGGLVDGLPWEVGSDVLLGKICLLLGGVYFWAESLGLVPRCQYGISTVLGSCDLVVCAACATWYMS